MLFLLCENKESAKNCGEEPLDGSIFEDIIRVTGDRENNKEKREEEYGGAKKAVAATLAIGTPQNKKETSKIRQIYQETNDPTLDIKFHEVIVGFVGTKTRTSE